MWSKGFDSLQQRWFDVGVTAPVGPADVLTLREGTDLNPSGRRNLPEVLFLFLHVQQTLREKLVELQALTLREKRLMQGEKTTSLPLLTALKMLLKQNVHF